MISAAGFTPDVFMPLIGGVLLDQYAGIDSYRYYYMVITSMCIIGTSAAVIIMGRTAGRKKSL